MARHHCSAALAALVLLRRVRAEAACHLRSAVLAALVLLRGVRAEAVRSQRSAELAALVLLQGERAEVACSQRSAALAAPELPGRAKVERARPPPPSSPHTPSRRAVSLPRLSRIGRR